MLISSPQYGNIPLTALKKITTNLTGCSASHCEMKFGKILVKQYHAEQYSIRYTLLKIYESVPLLFREKNPLTRNRLALKGSFQLKPKTGQSISVEEGQLLLLHRNDPEHTIYFEKGNEYGLFDTMYSCDFLQPLLQAFPSLVEHACDAEVIDDPKLIKEPRLYLTELKAIAHKLLDCPYDKDLQKIYFETKMKDYLFQAIVPVLQEDLSILGKKQMERQAVYAARDIILSDIKEHIPVRELASLVNLSQKKLKKGFREIFGSGIYEYLSQARMEKSRELLISTDIPIKEIAGLAGFDHVTNFSKAFLKRFGDTPGELRSKQS